VVPAGFDEWFVKATQRDRERRFQSAREMSDELSKVGGAVGAAARSAVLRTNQTPAVVPVAPGVAPASAHTPAPKDLQLTTGARSVTSRSVGTSGKRSPAVLVLGAVGGLIVVGAVAFVAFGGPKALLQGSETAVTPVITPAPVAAALSTPETAQPAVAAEPVAAPSAAKKEPEPAAEKPHAGGTVKKPAGATPPNNAPGAANPAPPKDWNF
jgi:serine/threonine-protein kinase